MIRRNAILGLSLGALLGLVTAVFVDWDRYSSTGFILAVIGSLVGCFIGGLYSFLRSR